MKNITTELHGVARSFDTANFPSVYLRVLRGLILLSLLTACASGSGRNSNTVELENKGTAMGVPTPEWVKIYLEKGLSALQAQTRYKDKYCIVGEESGVNRQFVISWADMASAQQRIGALLRTNIAGRYEAVITAASQSGAESVALYRQEINNTVNALVNVSYSGAQTITDRLNAGFSRMQEFDADITAMSLLAATGYNPQRLVDMLRELDKIQGNRSGGFNATHPSPASRMVNAAVAVNRYANTQDTGRFREKRFNSVKKQ